MPVLFIFLLKVNIALIVFCLGYYLVLRRLTFYTLNRLYLGIAIVFSTIYPLLNLDKFFQRHQQLAIPVQDIIYRLKAPAESFVDPLIAVYWHWAAIIFWIGAAVFAGRLSMQLLSLYKLYKRSEPGIIQEHSVRITDADISPFSFWQSIYINPANLNPADLKSVLQHEQVHVTGWHTIDILLTEITAIFYWFNPGVWLMKRAVRENIEFITDRKILQKGMDSKTYQYSLLNVSFNATASAGITNHFNFSTLKKRIIMMNAKRSSNVNLTRYAFLVPAVLICLFAITLSKAELVKKSKIAYKSITASVQTLSTVVTPKVETAIIEKKIEQKPTIDTGKKTQTITVVSTTNNADTGKKYNVKVVQRSDSVVYFINGVKTNKADMDKLSADDIASIKVNKGDVLISNTISVVKGTSISIVTKPVVTTNTISSDNATNTLHLTNPDGTVKEYQYRLNGVKVAEAPAVLERIPRVHINDVKIDPKIDNFDDKLIFIDGKEASAKDMKKLSAAEINSIDVTKRKDLVEEYGDKAKNGIIFITTKKKKQ